MKENINQESIALEKTYIQQRVESIKSTREWMKKASAVMDKLDFDNKYPIIVSLLRPSNNQIWDTVDRETTELRTCEDPVPNIGEIIQTLEDKLELAEKEGNTDEVELLKEDLKYINDFYNPDTKMITKVKELNCKYTDYDLFGFFEGIAEKLYEIIDNIPEEEKSLDREDYFSIYFANLFAHKINGCNVVIEDGQIKIQQTKIEYEK